MENAYSYSARSKYSFSESTLTGLECGKQALVNNALPPHWFLFHVSMPLFFLAEVATVDKAAAVEFRPCHV